MPNIWLKGCNTGRDGRSTASSVRRADAGPPASTLSPDRAVQDAFWQPATRYRTGTEGLMLNRFQGWRERGWSLADASIYARGLAALWRQRRHPPDGGRAPGAAGRYPGALPGLGAEGEVKAADPDLGARPRLVKDVLKRSGKKACSTSAIHELDTWLNLFFWYMK